MNSDRAGGPLSMAMQVRGGDRVHGALLPLLRLLPEQPQHPAGVEVDEHHLDDEVPVRGPADERVRRGPAVRHGARQAHRRRHPPSAGHQHRRGPQVADGALPPRLGRLLPRPLLPRPPLRLQEQAEVAGRGGSIVVPADTILYLLGSNYMIIRPQFEEEAMFNFLEATRRRRPD